jgi:hypothetical protein
MEEFLGQHLGGKAKKITGERFNFLFQMNQKMYNKENSWQREAEDQPPEKKGFWNDKAFLCFLFLLLVLISSFFFRVNVHPSKPPQKRSAQRASDHHRHP